MVFHDVELPDEVQYGSGFGAGFVTEIQESKTGHEIRIQGPAQARHRLVLQKDLQSTQEAADLKAFALGRRGAWASFKVKDWSDYTSASDGVSTPTTLDQEIGSGDGTNKTFYLSKTYEKTGPNPYPRRIKSPVTGTVVVAINGVTTTAFTVNADGVILFTSAPAIGAVVTAGFEFRVVGRFESEYEKWIKLNADSYDNWTLGDIAIVEVLDETEWPEPFWPGGGFDHGSVGSDIMGSFQKGVMQKVKPTANINFIFPHPEYAGSGTPLFVLLVDATASFTLQPRDDVGTAVGAALSAGTVAEFGLIRSLDGTTYVWARV